MKSLKTVFTLQAIGIIGLALIAGVCLQLLVNAFDRPLEGERVEIEVTPALPDIPSHVWAYLNQNYAVQDRNAPILLDYALDWCYGVYCEYWTLKPSEHYMRIMIRCWPDFGYQCVPTLEEEHVIPPPGNAPTVTPYAAPTRIGPGSGIGEPES